MVYFEVTVSIQQISEKGAFVTKNEKYLIDALSFTEAEKKTDIHLLGENFRIKSIKISNITEVYDDQILECKWYKAKVNFITINEEKNIEKKQPIFMLVQANSVNSAHDNLSLKMKGTVSDWEIENIVETKITEALLD